jgi:hypothetical protein
MTLQGAALVVHLFVDAGTRDPQLEHAYLRTVWRRLGAPSGPRLTAPLVGLPTEPTLDGPAGLLAGLRRPDSAAPHVEEALLRREHDTFCLSLMREPAGTTWQDLQTSWAELVRGLDTPPGLIGVAQIFLARLSRGGTLTRLTRRARPDPVALAPTVHRLLPDPVAEASDVRWDPGVLVSREFAVWEASETADARSARRIVVVAPDSADDALSGWTWVVGPHRDLPELGRYLMHAAKLRYQLRVWQTAHPVFRARRETADATVDGLLDLLAEDGTRPTSARLLGAAQQVTLLQADDRGLLRTYTTLVEMRRTADIATANLTALSDPGAGGLFADDRALGAWFGQQLDDDAVYVGAARDRAAQVATLTDQLLQRRSQDERERFTLAFTGAIGAILMVLTASQSFSYKPPLSPLVQPAVVTLLGAVALLSTLLMLRIIARGRWWTQVALWAGWGLVGAATAWVTTSALLATAATEATTRWCALAGFAGAAALAALLSTAAKARRRIGDEQAHR